MNPLKTRVALAGTLNHLEAGATNYGRLEGRAHAAFLQLPSPWSFPALGRTFEARGSLRVINRRPPDPPGAYNTAWAVAWPRGSSTWMDQHC